MATVKTDTYPTSGDLVPSLVRTLVPLAVGALGARLVALGVHVDDGTLTALVSAGYYAAARVAEIRFGRSWGWLLGYAKAPTYASATQPPASP